MAGMGPAPKPDGQKRNTNRSQLTPGRLLPAAGRAGAPPAWPLGRGTQAERKIWAELWATPQAAAWEDCGFARTVARYVRLLIQAEKPLATAATCGEVRQLEDRLGLTPLSMLRLRWAIEPEDSTPGLVVVPDVADRWKKAGGE